MSSSDEQVTLGNDKTVRLGYSAQHQKYIAVRDETELFALGDTVVEAYDALIQKETNGKTPETE